MFYRRMKSLSPMFSTALIIGGLCLGCSAASANTLHIYNASLTPGQESIVEMRLVPTPDVAGIQFHLIYNADVMEAIDPALTGRPGFENQGTMTDNRGSTIINYQPNQPAENGKKSILLAWADVKGLKATGLFMRFIFRAKDTATPGAQTDLSFTSTKGDFLMSDSKSLAVPSFAVFHAPDDPYAPGLPGDVNGDGQVTVADAVYALNLSVGLGTDPTPEQIAVGDVADGDGIVTIRDVTKLLQMVVGITTT